MPNVYDVIIIGSGPAGYTAALYASRANLKVLLFQGYNLGGQLMLTSDVENYPGFEQGILGPEMMEKFEAQARRFGTEMVARDVVEVDFSRRPFRITADGVAEPYLGRSVIIATGASAKWLGLPSEQRLHGRGVSACATCDGPFFRDQDIVVVGGGDTAMEEALFLTRYAKQLYVVHRRDKFRASKIMQDRVLSHPKIKVLWDSAVDEVLGNELVNGVRVRNLKTDETSELPAGAVFVAIGHEPNTKLFKGLVDMDQVGYIIQHEFTMTSVPGVFAAGDVVDHRYRQAVTAAADGCRAAIDAERWLEEVGDVDPLDVVDAAVWGDVPTDSKPTHGKSTEDKPSEEPAAPR
jgi:thioredoxin reductase (NADPH)